MWDLAEDPHSIALIEAFWPPASRSPRSAMRPACSTTSRAEGKPLVKGKRVTGFTNSEEEAVGLTKVVPFLVEDELQGLGGTLREGGGLGELTSSPTAGSSPARTRPRRAPLRRSFSTCWPRRSSCQPRLREPEPAFARPSARQLVTSSA